ncbi:MAG TPA: hypothetical protein DEA08_10390 [Planctomycetes bacterium]|nr:hypothetical protein [Planctomycetota bacterium]
MSADTLEQPTEPQSLWSSIWQRATWGDRLVYLGYVALVLLGIAGPRLLELDDPRLPVWEAFRDPGRIGRDPWGKPFSYPELEGERLRVDWIARSAGPNGVAGDEDDVLVLPEEPGFGRYELYLLLARLPWLGMLVVGGWELARLLRRPRTDLRTELGYAGIAGIGAGLGLAYLALALTERGPGRELREQLFRSTLVHPSISVIGSSLVAGVLLVLGLRGLLARPSEPDLEDPDPGL